MSRTYGQWWDKTQMKKDSEELYGNGAIFDWYLYTFVRETPSGRLKIIREFRHKVRGGATCNCRKKYKMQINKIRRQEIKREILFNYKGGM